MRRPLQQKIAVLLFVVICLSTLLVAVLALRGVAKAHDLAVQEVRHAVTTETLAQLQGFVQEKARRDELAFARVRSDARYLANFAAFIYDHPELFPDAFQGGTPLVRTPEGNWQNDPDTAVGVFVPRTVSWTPAGWREVGLMSYIDPLLKSLYGHTPYVVNYWVIAANGMARTYPHWASAPSTQLGPDYSFTEEPFFLLATPDQNPHRAAVWVPPYDDPAGMGRLMAAAVPVFSADGQFRAVVGAGMSLTEVQGEILALPPQQGIGFLLAADGQVLAAGEGADQYLPWLAAAEDGRLVTEDGVLLSAYASLPSTGWTLGVFKPEQQALQEAEPIIANLRRQVNWIRLGIGMAICVLLGVAWWATPSLARTVSRPVEQLIQGVRRMSAGELSARVAVASDDELGLLAREFNRMADHLQDLYATLEEKVQERSAALLAEEKSRQAKERELAVLAERQRLAAEIHDTLAQGFVGIIWQVEAAREAGDTASAEKHLEKACQLARSSLAEARASVWRLRPDLLQGKSLVEALEQLSQRLTAGQLRVELQVRGREERLSPAREVALLRVVQEALNNALRHAGATLVLIELTFTSAGVELQVRDNGQGFDLEQVQAGFGLPNMRERIEAVGGRLAITSKPGTGTVVRVCLPEGGEQNGDSDSGSG